VKKRSVTWRLPAPLRERPVYLRDVVDVERGYDSPPRYLNFYDWRDANGNLQRSRAITVAVQMRPGGYIGQFGEDIDKKLAELKKQLPDDLIMARTSDQPRQVTENVALFMNSLYEAIILVVIVSLIGFWDWRSALLMGLAIPITLFITFGMAHMLGIDLQQVSIATLIIALGLLVDVPVVSGDAIKNQLGGGFAGDHGLVGWADKTDRRDRLRDHHQHRRLSALPDPAWEHRANSCTACRSC
jgi:multidrug efflux pump subunit AcrB